MGLPHSPILAGDSPELSERKDKTPQSCPPVMWRDLRHLRSCRCHGRRSSQSHQHRRTSRRSGWTAVNLLFYAHLREDSMFHEPSGMSYLQDGTNHEVWLLISFHSQS